MSEHDSGFERVPGLPDDVYRELWQQVRQAGSGIEVSEDLRPRVLEQAGWIADQHRAWPRLVLAALFLLFSGTAIERRVGTEPLQLKIGETAPDELRSKSWRSMVDDDTLTSAENTSPARPRHWLQ